MAFLAGFFSSIGGSISFLARGGLPWLLALGGDFVGQTLFQRVPEVYNVLAPLADIAGLADDVRFWRPGAHHGFAAQSPLMTPERFHFGTVGGKSM